MKVYVVKDEEWIYGVFSSQEKAEEYIGEPCGCLYWEEMELDKGWTYDSI